MARCTRKPSKECATRGVFGDSLPSHSAHDEIYRRSRRAEPEALVRSYKSAVNDALRSLGPTVKVVSRFERNAGPVALHARSARGSAPHRIHLLNARSAPQHPAARGGRCDEQGPGKVVALSPRLLGFDCRRHLAAIARLPCRSGGQRAERLALAVRELRFCTLREPLPTRPAFINLRAAGKGLHREHFIFRHAQCGRRAGRGHRFPRGTRDECQRNENRGVKFHQTHAAIIIGIIPPPLFP
jgi:hypothetical protein